MNKKNQNILKLCSFYVSDWHLVTMLLPYISKNVDEEVEVATVLENNIENNIKVLLQKLNLKNEENILKINWTNDIDNINEKLRNNIGDDVLIIVNGTKEYIDDANEKIKEAIDNNIERIEKLNIKIKIVNCYEVVEFNGNITEILDGHDKILNTSGEKEIEEVFSEYQRKVEKIG